MNGFLVLLSHTMDDLPIGLFRTVKEAIEFADAASFDPTPEQREVFNTDCSTPCCINVVQFVDGKPVGSAYMRLFEEEAVA